MLMLLSLVLKRCFHVGASVVEIPSSESRHSDGFCGQRSAAAVGV